MTKSPTFYDVAAAAGVSHQTASRVVNSPDRVHPPTRRRVEAEIRYLGYVKNEAAANLGRQRGSAPH
jgi:DNA-binding LacI/PurR family transcriptional regulator